MSVLALFQTKKVSFVEVARKCQMSVLWLISVSNYSKHRFNLVLYNHPENIKFPGYFKVQVSRREASGNDDAFFPRLIYVRG